MTLYLRQLGRNITADGTFQVPNSTQGWIANNTDVPITLTLNDGSQVDLAVGQTHNWDIGGLMWSVIDITVSGMGSGWVGVCWGE